MKKELLANSIYDFLSTLAYINNDFKEYLKDISSFYKLKTFKDNFNGDLDDFKAVATSIWINLRGNEGNDAP